MKTYLRKWSGVLTLILAVVVCPVPGAQSVTKPPPQPPALRFLFLDESAGGYFYKVKDEYRLISSSPYSISAMLRPADFSPIEVFKQKQGVDPSTGAPLYGKIATITPPSSFSAALVVLTPPPGSKASPSSYGVEFVDNSPEAYEAGSVRILNRGRVQMAARMGTTTVQLSPGETKLTRIEPDAKKRLGVRIAVQDTAGWRMIDDNVVMLRARTRVTGLLIYSPSGMRHLYDPDTLYERGAPQPGHVWLTYSDTMPASAGSPAKL